MTEEVRFAKLPTCDKSNHKDKECRKEWARYEMKTIIYTGDINARMRRVREGN